MLWFILSIFIFSAFAQDTTPTDTTPTDTTPQVSEPACLEKLCRPWINSSTGTKSQCSRKSSSLDLRFILNLPEPRPETQIERATYAFCPVVDDVENFSLQQSASIAALDKDGNLYGKQSKADLWVYGMNDLGLAESPPGKLSPARVLVYDAMAPDCSPQEGQPGGPAFVTMLVFNVTLNKGLFTYTSDGKLIGNGFVPTCDSNNKCKLNPENKCIGYTDGAMNCAVCLSQPSDLAEKDLSIFTTYYGTDARGHTLLSGSSNPLNYMVFSAGQLFLKIRNGILGVVSSLESGINKGSTA